MSAVTDPGPVSYDPDEVDEVLEYLAGYSGRGSGVSSRVVTELFCLARGFLVSPGAALNCREVTDSAEDLILDWADHSGTDPDEQALDQARQLLDRVLFSAVGILER